MKTLTIACYAKDAFTTHFPQGDYGLFRTFNDQSYMGKVYRGPAL